MQKLKNSFSDITALSTSSFVIHKLTFLYYVQMIQCIRRSLDFPINDHVFCVFAVI